MGEEEEEAGEETGEARGMTTEAVEGKGPTTTVTSVTAAIEGAAGEATGLEIEGMIVVVTEAMMGEVVVVATTDVSAGTVVVRHRNSGNLRRVSCLGM